MPGVNVAMEPQENKSDPTERWKGLQQRTQSAIIMAVPALLAVAIGGFVFAAFIIVAAILMSREWDNLTAAMEPQLRYAGLAYIAIPCAALIWLRGVPATEEMYGGGAMVLFLLLTVWATDIGAYFAGRTIGGPKLAPAISPNKTWAGLGGGAIAAALVGMLMSAFTPYPATISSAFFASVIIAFISQTGDLFESWLKRRAGVKDSGDLIPGHGGLLDRVDGLMFAAPVYAFLVMLFA